MIEASTKLHPERSLAASWFMRAHDLFIELRELTRRSIERGDPGAAICSTIPGRVDVEWIILT
jgi:hypothetical protein